MKLDRQEKMQYSQIITLAEQQKQIKKPQGKKKIQDSEKSTSKNLKEKQAKKKKQLKQQHKPTLS